MCITRQFVLAIGLAFSILPDAPAAAQTTPADAPLQPLSAISAETFASVWTRVAGEFEAELGRATGTEARTAVYRRMLEQFIKAPEFAVRESPEYQALFARLLHELPDSATAQSVNAPLTNPASNALIERSGASQLIALASDIRRLFSADESAISLNLNAIVLFGGGKPQGRSAQLYYSQREEWRRLTGTVTFGAKVPEKEITGFSGLPSADELFDAIGWDVKVRLVGDRDPLASRWYPLLLGSMGNQVELLARIQGLPVEPTDVGPLQNAARQLLGEGLRATKRQIASSLQFSVKSAGVHVTNADGKNKYSVAALLDKGFEDLDLTANLSYNVADLPQPGATDPFKSKNILLSGGLTGSVLKGRIVDGRALELSASVQGLIFVDDAGVPIDRRNTFKLNTSLSIPFQLKGKIPISITWTNDPNNLKKEKYVTGQIGFTYDFAAVWEALKAQ